MKTFKLEQSEQKLREKARTKKGISREELYDILEETQLSLKELCGHIGLSARTIQLKNSEDQLPFNASEKALLIANVYNKGYTVFGNREKFIRWMGEENAALGDIKPKEYLGSYKGVELLLEELEAIEHGFVA
ncbi:MAG: antitoxin Xre/MbcA/ParS toxin-binding domain-containing protein [Bacteroidota bacterium]